MPVRSKRSVRGAGKRGLVLLTGTITIGGAGAVSALVGDCTSTTLAADNSITKTAAKTGRYSVTLDRKYLVTGRPWAMLEGPADAAFGNVAGNALAVRNVAAKTFDVQVFLASSGVDTETTSGNKIHWGVWAQEQ